MTPDPEYRERTILIMLMKKTFFETNQGGWAWNLFYNCPCLQNSASLPVWREKSHEKKWFWNRAVVSLFFPFKMSTEVPSQSQKKDNTVFLLNMIQVLHSVQKSTAATRDLWRREVLLPQLPAVPEGISLQGQTFPSARWVQQHPGGISGQSGVEFIWK